MAREMSLGIISCQPSELKKSVAASVNKVVADSTETPMRNYFVTQCKYIKLKFRDFKELLERQGALKNCEVRTHFHEPLRPIQVKGKRFPILVLPKVEENIQG